MVLKLLAIVLSAVVLSGPADEMESMRRSGDVDAGRVAELLEAGLGSLAGGSRAEACRDAFLRGELYRRADALLPGEGYAGKALEAFRAMRVDYLDLSAGQLGYIGEARVHRQLGEPQEALNSLAPLLGLRNDSKIKRMAELEAAEARLMLDPREALAKVGELGEAADWVRARAYRAIGEDAQALKFARTESAVSTAPGYERLELIAGLGALDEAESAAWARELAGAGRVDEAIAVLDGIATDGSARLYAALLQEVGRYDQAARHWRDVYEAERDYTALFAYARCQRALAEVAEGEAAAQHLRLAIDAYRRVVESDADESLRRGALRQWFYLAGEDAPRDLIEAQAELIAADPYLRYARVRVLRGEMEPTALMAELTEIADAAADEDVRALAILMRAELETDPRGALAILDASWDLLGTREATREAAELERVRRWIELGMTDRAAGEVLDEPSEHAAQTLLLVAEALADRYADNVAGDAQSRVIVLAGAAMTNAPADQGVALRAAELLMRIGARNDAVRVLSSLELPEAAVTLARGLRELGKPNEALDRLGEVDGPEAALERSLCLAALRQPERGLAEARSARALAVAGGDLWWRATLSVARMHLAMEDPSAARDVLRVSEALYPVAGRAWLMSELDTLKKELE